MLFWVAHGLQALLFACFFDLRKAYDCINWSKLFMALVAELGVDAGLVSMLQRMYKDVWVQVLLSGQLSSVFGIGLGVL